MRVIPWLCLSLLFLAPAALASPESGVAKLSSDRRFAAAQKVLAAEHDRTVADIVRLTQIPAPPFGEARRAEAVRNDFAALDLKDVEIDAEGNVTGVRPGRRTGGKGPFVAVAAHLDTVFPAGTDVTVRREGWRLSAPGVGDNSRSVATLLAWIRALDAAGLSTETDLLFVGNVGEEGAGDLRGVKHLFLKGPYAGRIAAFFSVDGSDPSGIVTRGVGSKRYRVTFTGPGGHSYGAFGIVNPMAALAGAVTGLYGLSAPTNPKTTYSASVVGGGTSVNSIPASVFLEVDLRSEDPDSLADLDRAFRAAVERAVAAENSARSTSYGPVRAELGVIGERPAGRTASDKGIVRVTRSAILDQGFAAREETASTDSNIPMSLGIPAVTIGAGGSGGRAHALDEWIDVEPAEMVRGMSAGLLAILAQAGVR
ncbi:MAG: M20/M25/M40 family metallo-hydrolase [Phenylobacterium sp.]|uniref:M20/M25/M40 family metallo-hydrolase n=1 Tax=Phenylobacterium sp. TaxID=1871053 RepID=UPI0025F052F7|nr:M20/M25/M40 family metallo-hydrolase [Phenylobacterium sp.]MCA6247484.1 M20/M25/M40 family metallo-hydrolase [Phenylobacterium sp.]MCA6253702.1 M20/M25/M40 family metallo-hydrolase [Phenylobacterium sp.]